MSSLDCRYYFAHPYSSWERGSNENLNGLIRQYFPKKMVFDSISDEEIKAVENRLNHRPRKRLKYKTPYEAFFKLDSHLDVECRFTSLCSFTSLLFKYIDSNNIVTRQSASTMKNHLYLKPLD